MRRSIMWVHLQMTARTDLRPARPSAESFQLTRVEIPCPELNRFLYVAVGSRWWWYSRLTWDYGHWQAYVARPELETWVAYISGTLAGYFELERQDGDTIEIAQFGLFSRSIGKGLGGALLTTAVERAWAIGAKRVTVHTCSLDHPHAQNNYEARGFRVQRVEERMEELPEQPLQPWPGANLEFADLDTDQAEKQSRQAQPPLFGVPSINMVGILSRRRTMLGDLAVQRLGTTVPHRKFRSV